MHSKPEAQQILTNFNKNKSQIKYRVNDFIDKLINKFFSMMMTS